jgi:hypothetical protein
MRGGKWGVITLCAWALGWLKGARALKPCAGAPFTFYDTNATRLREVFMIKGTGKGSKNCEVRERAHRGEGTRRGGENDIGAIVGSDTMSGQSRSR